MCGRFTPHAVPAEIADAFDLANLPPVRPLYNIAPASPVLALGLKPDGRTRRWATFAWGLIP